MKSKYFHIKYYGKSVMEVQAILSVHFIITNFRVGLVCSKYMLKMNTQNKLNQILSLKTLKEKR